MDYNAKFTEAYQSNRNLLASKGARMHTSPQLEIYCDEVKCSHGMPPRAARRIGTVLHALARHTRGRGQDHAHAGVHDGWRFDTVKMDGLRDRLRHLVERRLSGHKAVCADCDAATDPLERTEKGGVHERRLRH